LRERQEEIVPLLVGLINKRLSSDQGVSVDTVKALRMRHKAARKISSSPRLCCPT
jgi:FixJ family two-component response regulator